MFPKDHEEKDLILTMDMELQKRVEQIIEEELKAAKATGETMLDRAFVVMMNPKKMARYYPWPANSS
ncbi:hypothetical protein GCM10020331_039370 [Ectobacillus funiculus]